MTIEDYKELIIWATKQRVKSIHTPEFSFELSDLAFLDAPIYESSQKEELESSKILADAQEPATPKDEDELLFWSSNH